MDRMQEGTPIYGHSRGYRMLTMVAVLALVLSLANLTTFQRDRPVPLAGSVGFALLAAYAWSKAVRRTVVMTIESDGFSVCDPAVSLGLLRFEEIEEIRIYATLERPMVGLRMRHSHEVRRRTPLMMRIVLLPVWYVRTYQIVLELDGFNDQIMAIKSTAVRAGIPVVSELV